MTAHQWNQYKPSQSSAAYHASQGCDIRHKTNQALNHCEDLKENIDKLQSEGGAK